jgi:hypothetical protein
MQRIFFCRRHFKMPFLAPLGQRRVVKLPGRIVKLPGQIVQLEL